MQVKPAGETRIGADAALVLQWRQVTSDAGELEFHGRQVVLQPRAGALWVRGSDGLPRRIQAWAEYEQSKRKIRDEATVEYAMSQRGFLTPASMVRRHIVDGQTITENYIVMTPSGCSHPIPNSSLRKYPIFRRRRP